MARLNKKGELWNVLRKIEAFLYETAGSVLDTTITAAAAVGATTLTVAGTSNGAAAQDIFIGDGEARHLVRTHPSTAPTGTTVTLDPKTPVRHALAIGEVVKKAKVIDLGHIDGGSAKISHGASGEDVDSDTQLLTLGWLPAHYKCQIEGALLGYNVENIAFCLGILESLIRGDGTAADPRELTLDGDQVRGTDDLAVRLTGVKKNGRILEITAMACELDPGAFSYTLGRGTKTPLPFRARSTGGLQYHEYL